MSLSSSALSRPEADRKRFMDAEIGVRNLADPFRYNALPDIVDELGLMEGEFIDGVEEFEDLPEFEKLAMLTRAQSELNYAVHWSFLKAQVTMTDSLTASMKWTRYDDEFRSKNGYRLPADPYWLAPPQGVSTAFFLASIYCKLYRGDRILKAVCSPGSSMLSICLLTSFRVSYLLGKIHFFDDVSRWNG